MEVWGKQGVEWAEIDKKKWVKHGNKNGFLERLWRMGESTSSGGGWAKSKNIFGKRALQGKDIILGKYNNNINIDSI